VIRLDVAADERRYSTNQLRSDNQTLGSNLN
jgi:hypothetical protein